MHSAFAHVPHISHTDVLVSEMERILNSNLTYFLRIMLFNLSFFLQSKKSTIFRTTNLEQQNFQERKAENSTHYYSVLLAQMSEVIL